VIITSTTPTKKIDAPRLLLTRGETLAVLRIGETTLHWLARTRKLNPIRIGARVLFNLAEVERIARRGCSLTESEKKAAAKRTQQATDE
jgi:Helix-turn-helix domain